MNFYPYPGLEILKQENGLIANDRDSINWFWSQAEDIAEGLSQAIGVYIFSIRAGKGNLPWYIGKAEKRGFIQECFQHHKLTHYNNSIANRKGTPLLTLVPKFTQNEHLAQPNGSSHADISTLEKILIGTCIQKNSELTNIRDTKFHHEMILPGYVNTPPGGVSNSVKEFKHLIGV